MENQEVQKTCRTCGHQTTGFTGAFCEFSGYNCDITRRSISSCGDEYKAWIPRIKQDGILTMIWKILV